MSRSCFLKKSAWNWRWIKAAFAPLPLSEWLKNIPDPRSKRKKPHELSEVLICIILGFLHGMTKLRRIYRWCRRHTDYLTKYMPLPSGVPSVSTMSRILAGVDEEMVSVAVMNWICQVVDTRGIHIAIDGKGLRAAASKLKNERTPYILNAIDVTTRLVIGQLAIKEKTNEMTAIPQLIDMLEIEGSTITIDAIGTTGTIMEKIDEKDGYFLLQVKRNCPLLYDELMDMFDDLAKLKDKDRDEFEKVSGDTYSEYKTSEKNRDRYEHRKVQYYDGAEWIEHFQEERPCVQSVGRTSQVRVLVVQDADGTDVTPSLEEFLANGSIRQAVVTEGDGFKDVVQKAGLIANRKMNAKEMLEYHRNHWAIEDSLHYVLDETFGEDKCTVRKGKNALSMLRKCAYNIARLLQHEKPEDRPYIPDVIDDIADNFELAARYIFKAVPAF